MPISISSIEVSYVPFGSHKGTPCIRIVSPTSSSKSDTEKIVKMSSNEVISEFKRLTRVDGVLASSETLYANGKNVCIQGSLKDNPELRDVAHYLLSVGKKVFFIVDSSENIESLRMFKNIFFIVDLEIPTEEKNTLNSKLLPSMKEGDELIVSLSSVDSFTKAAYFFNTRTVSRPTVLFHIKGVPKEDREQLKHDYFFESSRWSFPSKVIS